MGNSYQAFPEVPSLDGTQRFITAVAKTLLLVPIQSNLHLNDLF